MISDKTFKDLASVQSLVSSLGQGSCALIDQLWPSAKAFWIASLYQQGRTVLCLCSDGEQQSRLLSELAYFCSEENLIYFPSWETLPSEPACPSVDVVGLRMKALWKLAHNKQPCLIIANIQAFQQRAISLSKFNSLAIHLQAQMHYPMSECIERLQALGYQHVEQVNDKGQYATRQGIVDLFAPQDVEPVRIEWWGDEIDQIRSFDLSSQRSLHVQAQQLLLPAAEVELVEPQAGLLDYLPADVCCVLDEIQAIEDRYVQIDSLPGALHSLYLPFIKALDQAKGPKIYLSSCAIDQLSDVGFEYTNGQTFAKLELFGQPLKARLFSSPILRLHERFMPSEAKTDLPPFFESLRLALEDGFTVKVLCASDAQRRHAEQFLQNFKQQERLELCIGYLSSSLVFEPLKLILAPVAEHTQHQRLWRSKLRVSRTATNHETPELELGCHVVHLHHGIGIYKGVEKQKDSSGQERDFLCLEYANHSKIYVPLDQAHLLSRYQAFDERPIDLHQIGSSKWKKQWQMAQTAIQGYAKQLLELYATRQVHDAVECPSEDSTLLEQFEADFPYEVTEDQQHAIQAVKADLCRAQPMDRLICGDVGYGKTEVAMRATFKMVVDGKAQVAVLTPTTVLALQHYETFCERMDSFGVRLAVLSRFTTPKEKKRILDELEKGLIDVLVGTHRLLSPDVKFNTLGLMIVDEEHRFGVKAKEHLKMLKKDVNCLSLSATPIPRTLHLSLMGAKELSTIATPPYDRQPISTFVCAKEDQVLKAALIRELGRGGQAFFVHNDIDSLSVVATHLKRLMPQARIGIVHGQMKAQEIEQTFHDFKSHLIDILLVTTIIETGIDIPNANTIFIDQADRFGLSDLYQLRGRVGRWNRKAYAYLFFASKKTLSEIAKKRLDAIQLANGYGGGMKVALRDLEIRGCGELLGEQQSGHVSSIGFSLYCKLLQRTIEKLQGKTVLEIEAVRIDHNLPIQIPTSYIKALPLRLEIYQRMASFSEMSKVEQMRQELRDRFGPLPPSALWLLCLSQLRIQCAVQGISHLNIQLMDPKIVKINFEQQLGAGRSRKVQTQITCEHNPHNVSTRVIELFEKPKENGQAQALSPKLKDAIKQQVSSKAFSI